MWQGLRVTSIKNKTDTTLGFDQTTKNGAGADVQAQGAQK